MQVAEGTSQTLSTYWSVVHNVVETAWGDDRQRSLIPTTVKIPGKARQYVSVLQAPRLLLGAPEAAAV